MQNKKPYLSILFTITLLLCFNIKSFSQCVWTQVDFEGFEYATPSPDLIPGTIFHPNPWTNGNEHSGGSYLYMNFVNGLPSGSLVYERFYTVCAGQQYQTSSWFMGVNGSFSNITLRIVDGNGVVLDTWSGSSVSGVYINHISNIVIPTTTTISFQLISDGAPGNNDMAFDDLSLSSCISPSEDEGTINICQAATSINLYDSLTTLTGNSGTWTGPSGLSNGFQGTFDPSTNANGVYTYTIVNGGACPDSVAFFTLTINSSPNLTTTNVTSCGTSSANITTSFVDNNATGGAVTYWQDALATIPELTPTNITTAGTYYIVMDASGCSDTASVVVSFTAPQVISFGPDTLLCHDQTLTLDAGAGFNYYLWDDGSTNQTLTVNTADTFWVQGFSTGGNLIINGDFESGSTGFTTDYTVGTGGPWGPISNPGTYLVTNNANTAHSNFLNCTDHTSGAGNMMVVNGASIPNQNVWCQTIPVTANTDYEFSTWVQNYDLNNPAQLAFFINGTQIGITFTPTSAGCTWQNFFELWNSGGATSANICIVNQSVAGGGNDFSLDDISFSPLCESSDTIIVTIDLGPVVTVPANLAYCHGDPVPASAYSSVPLGATYAWSNTNITIGLGASAPGNTPAFTAANTSGLPVISTISVIPTLNSCPGPQVDYTITVNPIPAAPTSASPIIICPNNSTTITATAPGGPYEWYDAAVGGTLLFTGASYTTPVLNANTSYWVQSTANNCTSARTQVDVTMGAGLIVDAGLDVTICEGQSTTLGASPNVIGNTFEWFEPSNPLVPFSTVFDPTVSPIDTTIYTVRITDVNGCIGTDNVVVNVKPAPIAIVPATATYCSGDPVFANIYSSIPTGATYTWTNSDPSIGLAASGITPFTPGFTATNTTGQPITATISVTASLNGCFGTPVDHLIIVNPIPTLVIPADDIYCIGDAVPASHFSGSPQGTTFGWTNSDPSIGLGSSGQGDTPPFTATNTTGSFVTANISVTPFANGCTGTPINYTITISSPIIINRVITDISCFGYNDGEIEVIPNGGTPNYSYSWTSGDTDSIVSNLLPGSVTITVTDVNNCTQDSTFTIIEPDSIDYITFDATPVNGCSPLEVTFSNTTNPGLVSSFVWDLGNNSVPQTTYVTETTYFTSGSYDVSLTVTDNNGCFNTLTETNYITVFEDPDAHFSTTPENVTMLNPTVNFTDLSHHSAISWEWNFDSLGTSTLQHPSFTFPEDSGRYQVTLIVENENTCRDTLTKTIIIRSEIALFLPNSFTPNGDGLNDIFSPKGFGISEEDYSFLVFNRWGELVFETNNILSGWDGTSKGELLPSGVYIWRIDFRDYDGNTYRRNGQFSILR